MKISELIWSDPNSFAWDARDRGGVGGAVSEDDEGVYEPDSKTGGDDGVRWMGQVVCIYSYVPLNFTLRCLAEGGNGLVLG